MFASDLYGRLQRLAILNAHTDLPLIFYLLLIIDPHEILLLCVCESSILIARMCEFAHCYYSLFVMNIFWFLMVPRVVIVARCYSCSKQF